MEELENNIDEVQTEDTDGSGPKGLRDENKRLKEELKEYKTAALQSTVKSLNLHPAVAKAVTKLYDGKPDVDAISDFVKQEFGDDVVMSNTAPVQQNNFTDASQRVDKLSTSAVSDTPQSREQALNDIIKNGTLRQSLTAKLAAMDVDKI
jgi:hypothetical protein